MRKVKRLTLPENTYELKHLCPFKIFVSPVIIFQNGEMCCHIRFYCLYAFFYCDGQKYVWAEMYGFGKELWVVAVMVRNVFGANRPDLKSCISSFS